MSKGPVHFQNPKPTMDDLSDDDWSPSIDSSANATTESEPGSHSPGLIFDNTLRFMHSDG